eukprot:GHVU01175472.1.p1 GENE.GHVU01175472.1~~GHVU01175472.1.p1  ORF type:complete len:128 (-),score=10.50 GHVU01175472.1:61-444(-)
MRAHAQALSLLSPPSLTSLLTAFSHFSSHRLAFVRLNRNLASVTTQHGVTPCACVCVCVRVCVSVCVCAGSFWLCIGGARERVRERQQRGRAMIRSDPSNERAALPPLATQRCNAALHASFFYSIHG